MHPHHKPPDIPAAIPLDALPDERLAAALEMLRNLRAAQKVLPHAWFNYKVSTSPSTQALEDLEDAGLVVNEYGTTLARARLTRPAASGDSLRRGRSGRLARVLVDIVLSGEWAKLTAAEKALLPVILANADASASEGSTTLARMAGLHVRTARLAERRVVARGILKDG